MTLPSGWRAIGDAEELGSGRWVALASERGRVVVMLSDLARLALSEEAPALVSARWATHWRPVERPADRAALEACRRQLSEEIFA